MLRPRSGAQARRGTRNPGTKAPRTTRAPCDRAESAKLRTSVVLPMPAGPSISTAEGLPVNVRWSFRSSSARSARRGPATTSAACPGGRAPLRPAALRLLNDTGVDKAPDHRSVVLLSELADVELGPLLGLDRPSTSGRLHDGGDLFTLDRLFQLARELTDQFRIQPSSIVAFGFASTDAFLPISLSLGALMSGARLLVFDNAFALRHPQRWYQTVKKSEATHVLAPGGLGQGPWEATAIAVASINRGFPNRR